MCYTYFKVSKICILSYLDSLKVTNTVIFLQYNQDFPKDLDDIRTYNFIPFIYFKKYLTEKI